MSTKQPFISLVVPTYNRADLIAGTLATLQKQDYDNYEIIVVDDGSTDNTEQVVTGIKDQRIKYIKKDNAERAAARNFGARMARGEYVNFFDSDDLALPNHLAEAARLIKEKGSPEWFHLCYAWVLPETPNELTKIRKYKGDTLNHILLNGNGLSCNGVFVRKDIAMALPFNEDRALSASEDYELWVRLAARYPLYYSNEVTSVVVDHENRSVRRVNGDKLIQRLNLLVRYLKEDDQTQKKFGMAFKTIVADSYSYIALHLADNPRFKITSLKYLKDAVATYPGLIRNKRFYVIFKNLLFKWQGS